MTDSTISNLPAATVITGIDLLSYVDDPSGTPLNKKLTLNFLFGNIPANTSITGTLDVSANTVLAGLLLANANSLFSAPIVMHDAVTVTNTAIVIAETHTPASSVVTHKGKGSLFWDDTYLYMETSTNIIKRIKD